jgi:copper homeostasis protein
MLVEIAANSLKSALAAQRGGADRIELCEFLDAGGVTPSYGTIALSRDHLQVPLLVLIRPRAGNFCYDELERELMLRDIENCQRLGCDGVVIGALTAQGEIDKALCQQMMAAAGKMAVTFHRAFDCAMSLSDALRDVQSLGVQRVLSSGRAASAQDGAAVIAHCVAELGSSIELVAGAGVNAKTVQQLIADTGVRAVHASARSLIAAHLISHEVIGLSSDYWETSEQLVRDLVLLAKAS